MLLLLLWLLLWLLLLLLTLLMLLLLFGVVLGLVLWAELDIDRRQRRSWVEPPGQLDRWDREEQS